MEHNRNITDMKNTKEIYSSYIFIFIMWAWPFNQIITVCWDLYRIKWNQDKKKSQKDECPVRSLSECWYNER